MQPQKGGDPSAHGSMQTPTLLSQSPAAFVLTILPALFSTTFEDNYKAAFSSLTRAKTCVEASL